MDGKMIRVIAAINRLFSYLSLNKTVLFKNRGTTLGAAGMTLLFLMMATTTVFAQFNVSGTVVDDSDGQPLSGVNIIVKGTTIGTSTSADGTYSLEIPSGQDTLMVSFIGYIQQEIPVNGRNTIDVSLAADVAQLEDVVVVGYGTQEQQQITGSVSSVKSEDFVSGNINNASELVQGKVPGLTISNAGGGDPNSSPTIRMRGVTTFSANQEPLVVVDGIIGASLDNIDPNDIESIDVLKDASASAIYGTRGAAGVIVVTTKSGMAGGGQGVSVNYNGYYTVETIENKLEVLSASEFRRLSDETGIGINDLESSTDWYDRVTQLGSNNVHSLALSGGTEHSNYRISGNFRDRQGIQKGTGFEQINGRINLTQRALDDNLELNFNLGVTSRESDFSFGEVFRYAQTMNPTAPVTDEGFENTGGYTEIGAFDILNPVAIMNTSFNEGKRSVINGSLKASYDFDHLIPGISASVFYSMEDRSELNNQFFSKTNKWQGQATQSSLGAGLANRYSSNNTSELFETTVEYVADIDQLRLESIAGYSYNDFESENTFAGGGDFVTDAVEAYNLAFAQDFSQGEGTVNSFKSTHKIIGFFGRLNLSWDNSYFLNGSIRREGSSRFGVDNKWGTFFALGAGIDLVGVANLTMFDQFKLRGSYGVTGQDAPFNGISKLRFGPQGNFFVDGSFVQSFGPVSNPNPNLKWEENREWNVGVDLEALDSRLAASFEYYRKNTEDLLFEVQVPVPPNLYPTTWKNVGELENEGFDASLEYAVIQSNDLNWTTNLTFSTFNTVLKQFISEDEIFVSNAGSPGQNSTPLVRVKEGEPIGQIWGKKFAGISEEGQWLFYDAEGNKVLNDETTLEDERVLGNGLPDFSLGWTNSLTYRNFDLSFFFRGDFGHDMVNTFRLFYETPSSISTWNVLQSAFDYTELTSPPQFSSLHVEDASYVKLQNATIGYSVPVSETAYVKKLRLYVSGNNLFTITDYKGINPEPRYIDNVGGGGPLAPGIERRDAWITTRSVTAGVQLNF
ncbi:SusC/RagA family TonB-linked outer membrane protein [Fodinibius sediminis]|uniref:Iron complex outermembrane recepter protein n=1 Tax=Fodinibius sediminis TaxID=1214077 RepID=A0A521CVY8_9BACT|nr:SusC/RagA family TonB-linked outer membrane protein [Fodinibius sediminis]SMO62901.1 iron complex outermembrane recepter protein [Fodinibius sediminis]